MKCAIYVNILNTIGRALWAICMEWARKPLAFPSHPSILGPAASSATDRRGMPLVPSCGHGGATVARVPLEMGGTWASTLILGTDIDQCTRLLHLSL